MSIVCCAKDNISNYAGFQLIQTVYRLDLHILNGNTTEDIPGEFTSWSGVRISTINYLIVSYNIWSSVHKLKIDCRLGSDNLPLNLYLRPLVQCIQIKDVLWLDLETVTTNTRNKGSEMIEGLCIEPISTDHYRKIHITFITIGPNNEIIE